MNKPKTRTADKPKTRDIVFNYTSKCCHVKAVKPALLKTEKKQGSLGTWKCTKCGRTCACNRTKVKNEEIIS